tara:strand:+ start:292 stop:861 length:570 start_codon:yes stop_codon:yes gene_type:complete
MNLFFKSFAKYSRINSLLSSYLFILTFLALSACALPEFAKPSKIKRDAPTNAKERARQNVEQGRGVSLKGVMGGNKSTNYEFSTSNPLWRASLEVIDFMPLSTVDYSGGIIITDWYSDSNNFDESIKITVRFLSNEIRSNSIKIIVHNKKCKANQSCSVNEIDSNIKFELQRSILRKAALLEKETKKSK